MAYSSCPIHSVSRSRRLPQDVPQVAVAVAAGAVQAAHSLTSAAGHSRLFSSSAQVREENAVEAPSDRPTSADSAWPSDRRIVPAHTAEEPAHHRKARSDAIKVLNRIARFRTRTMRRLKPIDVYKYFLNELPNNFDSPHHHPELWARLVKIPYKQQESECLRLIAVDALNWCASPAAKAFVKKRNTNGDEERSMAIEGPLPATTANLKLLIRNLIQADEFRLQKTATIRAIVAEKKGLTVDQDSIVKAKRRVREIEQAMARLDTSKIHPDELAAAERFAWAAKIKHGPTDGVPDSKIKALTLDELTSGTTRGGDVRKKFQIVRGKEAAKAAKLAEKEAKANNPRANQPGNSPFVQGEDTWPESAKRLVDARRTGGETHWNKTLDRFRAWAEDVEPGEQGMVGEILNILKHAVAESEVEASASTTSKTNNATANAVANNSDSSSGAVVTKWDNGVIRPPTYLLLATLRQLVLRGDPKRSLALAQSYLSSLLRDAKAGRVDVAASFSAHSACDEVPEPAALHSSSEEGDPSKDKSANDDASSSPVLSLFLRSKGPTFSVTSSLVPPKGHEILNAVLRAHLQAGSPTKEMLRTLRALCGVRVGRLIRKWESERRLEMTKIAKKVNLEARLSAAPLGLSREHHALWRKQWLERPKQPAKKQKKGTAVKEVLREPAPPNWLAARSALTPSEARSQTEPTRVDLGDRIQRAEHILCFPNEETFLIILEQMRKHNSNIADAIALINVSMAIWGPPPIEPILVPTNINPRMLTQPMAMSKENESEWEQEYVHPRSDPYLIITTATVRKLLRWAIYSRREGNGHRLMQAAEVWIRRSREWRAALQQVPVFTYEPGLRIAEDEAKAWLASNLGIDASPDEIDAPTSVDTKGGPSRSERRSYTYTPDPNVVTFSQEKHADGTNMDRLNTWMSVDGGRGYIGPTASGHERDEWYEVLKRAMHVHALPAGRNAGTRMDSWLSRAQISLLRGEDKAGARQSLMAGYEALYMPAPGQKSESESGAPPLSLDGAPPSKKSGSRAARPLDGAAPATDKGPKAKDATGRRPQKTVAARGKEAAARRR
ncbi:hypothetical protein A4X06_0g7231 [Tilletia controversa]|uniref:Uncharacterized protein n=1 Tax=Tilletia controversa TaxID=13291 RepID=A0A8X7SUA6_9BASI|nr:hypothetical protein CF328_g6407 [Tilletia controversa]KAE8242107.1 hypothetical protein A4X06_0g7231 [Tilletia controversa]